MVILLQQGKGDMAAAFGGGSSQSAFGARAGATVLSKATAILAVLFMVGALALAIMGQRGPGSLLSGAQGPKPAAPATVPRHAASDASGAAESAAEVVVCKAAATPQIVAPFGRRTIYPGSPPRSSREPSKSSRIQRFPTHARFAVQRRRRHLGVGCRYASAHVVAGTRSLLRPGTGDRTRLPGIQGTSTSGRSRPDGSQARRRHPRSPAVRYRVPDRAAVRRNSLAVNGRTRCLG
jgi:preprotein translocase subunit SecG